MPRRTSAYNSWLSSEKLSWPQDYSNNRLMTTKQEPEPNLSCTVKQYHPCHEHYFAVLNNTCNQVHLKVFGKKYHNDLKVLFNF